MKDYSILINKEIKAMEGSCCILFVYYCHLLMSIQNYKYVIQMGRFHLTYRVKSSTLITWKIVEILFSKVIIIKKILSG